MFISFAIGTIPGSGSQSVVNALALLGTGALPVCLGVAVLKYRLYELDRVISRVVSYTLITALLGGVFAGLILLATRVLPVRGSVAVAAATLVVAALFNPLRKRVQHAVDRRFNRERYDAEAVVAAFTAACSGPSTWTRSATIWSVPSMRRSSPPTHRSGCPGPHRPTRRRLSPSAARDH